jgi:acetyl-CoA acetyltransferase family protein
MGVMDAYLIDAARTPFGRYRGGLGKVRTDDLAAMPIAELIARHPGLDPASIEDVYYGNANGSGEDNRNVARMATLLAGLPESVPGVTINRLCASGAEAIVQATRAVRAGDARLVLAGGVESMSRAPYVIPRPDEELPRSMEIFPTALGWRMVNPKFPSDWTDPLGVCAERVAVEYGIGREAMDDWSLRSHTLAHQAWEKGSHDGFTFAVDAPGGRVERDESIRPGTTAEKLAALPAAFGTGGPGTAGNSSPLNDGAAAVLVGTAEVAGALGAEPLARVIGSATVGVQPDRFSVAPVDAVRKLLARADRSFADIAVWEINEAFASMVLSCLHDLPELDQEKVNVQGGAIAYGHPLGASAPRVVVDAARQLRRRGGGLAVATACIGVGQGQAVLLEG